MSRHLRNPLGRDLSDDPTSRGLGLAALAVFLAVMSYGPGTGPLRCPYRPPRVRGQGREALPVFFGVMSYGPMTWASRRPRGRPFMTGKTRAAAMRSEAYRF